MWACASPPLFHVWRRFWTFLGNLENHIFHFLGAGCTSLLCVRYPPLNGKPDRRENSPRFFQIHVRFSLFAVVPLFVHSFEGHNAFRNTSGRLSKKTSVFHFSDSVYFILPPKFSAVERCGQWCSDDAPPTFKIYWLFVFLFSMVTPSITPSRNQWQS